MKFRRTPPGLTALAAIPWFTELPVDQLALAARYADWVGVEGGTRLQRQGFHAGWLWVPTNGVLELRREGRPVGDVAVGGAWGETELLLGAPSTVDVVAPVWSTVVSLPAAVFHGMLSDSAFATGVAKRQARASVRTSSVPSLTDGPLSPNGRG